VIAAIVLAAGASRRFGSQKMRAPIAGRPLVRWTVEHVLASRVDDVVIVAGREAPAVRDALAGLPVRVVTNARYTDGLSTSLDAGLDALGDSVRAAVIVLGDQPSVAPETIDALIDAYRDGGKPIAVPVYRGRRGNPVLFDAALFDELRTVRGDRGARDVIAREPARVVSAPLDLALPRDVDEPDDLEILERQFAVTTEPSHIAPASERERGLR
jgi:molybdenum cofactor cytidylyltransferase